DLRDERTGSVDRLQASLRRPHVDGRRDAVRGEDDGLALGHVVLGLDEDRAACFEIADDMLVVDDLVADVHGPVVMLEPGLDALDGALDTGAEAAGRGEQDAADHRSIVPSPPTRTWLSRKMAMGRARGSGGSAPRAIPKLLTAG